MSDHVKVPKAERFDLKKASSLEGIFKAAAAIGIIGWVIFFAIDRSLGAHAWLFAFMYFFTVLCGCFFWNCLHHATDSEWSVVVRRQIENLSSLLKYIGVFFVPIALIILFGSKLLYAWMTADPKHDSIMAGTKGGYLNLVFFWVRAGLFFFFLFWISNALRSHSMAQDKDGKASHTISMRRLSVAGIPTLALCLTFAGIDWLQTLNHHWYSTMWGVYLFAGAVGAAMALIVVTCKWLQTLGYLKPITEEHYHIMGKFLLAFTIFWAYIGFSQYMLITYANIEEETVYFRLRNTGSWHILSTFLVFGRFFFMFIPLLFQGIKKSQSIMYCAVWILLMQFLDLYLIVMPEYSPAGFTIMGFLATIFPWLAIAGSLGVLFLKHLGQGVTFPTKDPRLADSLKYSN